MAQGAGSLVAYRSGNHRSRPAWQYNPWLFERFLNPERVSMPDFDIDFCQDGRDRVIDYVRKKYGEESGRPDRHLWHHGGQGGGARLRPRATDMPYTFVDGARR